MTNWFERVLTPRPANALSDSDFRTLFEMTTDSLIIADNNRVIVAANKANEAMFNDRIERIVGTRIDDYMCPDFHQLDQLWQKFLEVGELKGDICIKRRDGIIVKVNYIAKANAIPDRHLLAIRDNHEQRRVFELAQDSERKLEESNKFLEDTKYALINVLEDFSTEKQLVEQEKKKVEAVLASIGDAVFVTDISGHINLMNSVAEEYCGHRLTEARGQHYTRIFHFVSEDNPDVPYPDFVNQVVATRRIKELSDHVVLVKPNNERMPVSDSAAPILNPEGNIVGCVVVVRDFTRERKLEQAKDEFLSVAAHQLRTPLGALRWGMELLLAGDIGPLTQKEKTMVGTYHQNILRMITLVNDLLDVSRIDQGRVRDEPVETDITALVEELIDFLNDEAKEKKVTIALDKGAIPLPIIMIDKKHLSQVLENIMSNAIKYCKADGGLVNVRLGQDTNYAKLEFEDNGIGIPPTAMKNLFTKFFRAENAVLNNTEGSGLGLYLAKKYVEKWGGSIEVRSELDRGTIVTINIPKQPKASPKVKTAVVLPVSVGI